MIKEKKNHKIVFPLESFRKTPSWFIKYLSFQNALKLNFYFRKFFIILLNFNIHLFKVATAKIKI